MAISAFSNLIITIHDGGTVPSLGYSSNKTFVDIGSGNILKVSWNTPADAGNAVDSYIVCIRAYDAISNSYKYLYNANVGNINEFYLKSSLATSIQRMHYQLAIYVEAISKYGAAYNGKSAEEIVYVSRGCGTYVKVSEGYKQPIMKRAIAFTRPSDNEKDWVLMQEFYQVAGGSPNVLLVDADGKAVLDSNGKSIYIDTRTWRQSDIQYEVLTDANGEIVTDIYNENVYVL